MDGRVALLRSIHLRGQKNPAMRQLPGPCVTLGPCGFPELLRAKAGAVARIPPSSLLLDNRYAESIGAPRVGPGTLSHVLTTLATAPHGNTTRTLSHCMNGTQLQPEYDLAS